jgi:hypothetical protein
MISIKTLLFGLTASLPLAIENSAFAPVTVVGVWVLA